MDLHELLADFARFGDTGDGGVCRLTATTEDRAARDRLMAEMRARGLAVTIDPVGNMFGLARLVPGVRETVLVGSHVDSQPTGGRYDGIYGVLAGLLAVAAVQARAAAHPGRVRRNLALVNWTNEEGARFQPSLTGSSVFAGTQTAETALALRDGDGISLGEALEAIGYRGEAGPDIDPVHYVELHVEQGARLEDGGLQIGVVEGIWGTRKISIVFEGEPAHTGPTPMARRHDALRAGARAIEWLHCLMEAEAPGGHCSAARLTVAPNSPNVVPYQARIWFEIRHEDEALAFKVGDRFLAGVAADAAELGVGISVVADEKRGATMLDADGAALVRAVAGDLGFSVETMRCVAGHDAFAVQRRLPASLIFVPSHLGLSHTPREFTAPADLDRGLAVLTETLWRMVTADN